MVFVGTLFQVSPGAFWDAARAGDFSVGAASGLLAAVETKAAAMASPATTAFKQSCIAWVFMVSTQLVCGR
jgi:hypothetical protein